VARTVLIVDDHAGFRSWARSILDAEGYDVVGEAEDGLSAIAAVRELRPQVVLLDIQLPDIDGFEVVKRVLVDGDAPTVVLISSRDASDYGRRISTSGARGFIPKAELSGETLEVLLAEGGDPGGAR
jgi:DNA-binding NarL/FixJ family response regulator